MSLSWEKRRRSFEGLPWQSIVPSRIWPDYRNLMFQTTGLPVKPSQDSTPHPADPIAEDPEVARVLDMLERDILFNPELLKPIDQSLVNLMAELSEGVEFDLNASLSPDDEYR